MIPPGRYQGLAEDAAGLRELAASVPWLGLLAAEGEPPERYRLEFRLTGAAGVAGDSLVLAARHVVEVFLPLAYPRLAPCCQALTPIVHPNVAPGGAYCLAPWWQPGQPLADTVRQLAGLIGWRAVDLEHAADPDVAEWARSHPDRWPSA